MDRTLSTANIFTKYEQPENHFTNGLFSLLNLSTYAHPKFIASFLNAQLSLTPKEPIDNVRVLKEIDGHSDAELCGKDCCIWFETKIESGNLDHAQVRRHLRRLDSQAQRKKILVLLTPDDGKSHYIKKEFLSRYENVLHLGWKSVYHYLRKWSDSNPTETMFLELVREFLDVIRKRVFEQDIAGIIQTIQFGDISGVYADKYLREMKKGDWKQWRTPRQYKPLDGTGRKLMLYDKTREAITVEVEIEEVKETKEEKDYPWSNVFVRDKLLVLPHRGIRLSRIREIPGLEKFGKGQAPYRKLTQEQYQQLKENRSGANA